MNKFIKKVLNYSFASLTNFLIILVILTSATVLFGWFSHNITLVQLDPTFAPMQFNTALCFLFSATAFLLINLDKRKTSLFFTGIVFTFSFLTLIEYITNQSLGIDELFIKSFLENNDKFPGRMSPATGISFVLLSAVIGLFYFIKKSSLIQFLRWFFVFLLIGLSTIEIIGYIMGSQSIYLLENYSQMALHTSILFFLLSLVVLFKLLTSPFWHLHRILTPIFISATVLVIFVIMSTELHNKEQMTLDSFVEKEVKAIKDRMIVALESRVLALIRMKDREEAGSYPNEKALKKDAENYINDFADFQAIEKVNKSSKVEWVIPIKGNEQVLNKVLNKEFKRSKTFNESISTGKPLFTPILDLIQGGKGVLIILPMYDSKKRPKGQIVAVYKVNNLLKSLFGSENLQNYSVKIINEDTLINANEDNDHARKKLSKSITISQYNLNWKVIVTPKTEFLAPLLTLHSEIILIFGLIMSLLVGILTYFLQLLKVKNDEAKKAFKAKSDFLANISHEIRTPLNGIIGMSNILESNLESTENSQKLRIIKESSKSLLSLVNDILDYSKIEANKIELENVVFNIETTVMDVYYLFSTLADKKNINLNYNIKDDIKGWYKNDETRIKQILNNLLSNAIKFTENGDIKITVSKVKDLNDSNTIVSFKIEDTGIGISQESLSKLFQNFSQADSSTTRKYGGTGLGLSICKSLSELLKGKILVDSTPGEGSCFEIQIPLLKVEAPKNTVKESITKKDISINQDIRILTAEDNPINQVVIANTLKKIGFNTDFAGNGVEVLEMVQQFDYDIILMDCHMPELDGYEATKKIIEQFGENRPYIIALTASTLKEDRDRCFESGMDDFLSKPIDLNTLKIRLDKASENKSEKKISNQY